MTDEPESRDLSQPDEKDRELARALKHPVVQHMAKKLDEMRSMVEQLPEAIGRAVAEAMRNRAPEGASGPPMQMVPVAGGVEFGRGAQVKVAGKEEEGDPVGIRSLLEIAGATRTPHVETIAVWSAKQRQQAVAWARATILKKRGQKGVRVPQKPKFL